MLFKYLIPTILYFDHESPENYKKYQKSPCWQRFSIDLLRYYVMTIQNCFSHCDIENIDEYIIKIEQWLSYFT